jgi:hypothetical protein
VHIDKNPQLHIDKKPQSQINTTLIGNQSRNRSNPQQIRHHKKRGEINNPDYHTVVG